MCARAAPHPIRLTAYSSLGSGARPAKYQRGQPALLADATLGRLAHELATTPAALALAWAVREGVAIIPKSTHAAHIGANLDETLRLAPRLGAAQLAQIDALDRQFHYLQEGWRGYAWRDGMSLDELLDDPAPAATAAHAWAWQLAVALLVLFAVVRRCARR